MGTERPRKKQPRVFSIFYELQHMSVHVVCVCVCVCVCVFDESEEKFCTKSISSKEGRREQGPGSWG